MKKIQYLLLNTLVLLTLSLTAQKWGNYTLYSIQNATSTQLIDTTNTVFKTWSHGTAKTGYSSYLMPGGILWRSIANTGNSLSGGGMTGRIQKVAWDGTVLWDFTYSSTTYCLHHDFCPLPNGNVLLISYDVKTSAEVTTAGSSFNGTVWSEKIIEVQPSGATTGNIVWEWKLWDHLVQNTDANKANYQTSVLDHPELMNVNFSMQKDWIHMNGIDYNPLLDQLSLSSHNLNQWFIIDHSTTTAEAASHAGGNAGKGGDFLYRYGNPASYGASGSTALNVTHDAHWIPEGFPNAGRLVGFNNGATTTASSVDQIDLPLSGYNYTRTAGSAYTPATYTQRQLCSGKSSNMGNSQQLPNGNMLICVATTGLIYEVNAAGTTLWSKTNTGSVPQAFRYEACYVNNAAPAIPVVSQVGSSLNSTAATSYQWYVAGVLIAGATSQNYTPVKSGIYIVKTTDANGCVYQYSKGITFTYSTVFDVTATATKDTVCNGVSTQLTANVLAGTGTSTYQWTSIPAGYTASTQNITVSPGVSTVYKVVVVNNGLTDSAEVRITVNQIPVANAGNDVSIIKGDSTLLTASGGTSYSWSTGEHTASIKVKPITTTVYNVTVTNAAGCSSADAVKVTVTGGPFSIQIHVSDSEVCSNTTILLDAIVSGGSGTYTYSWSSVPAGVSSTADHLSVIVNQTTEFKLISSDGIDWDTATAIVIVHPAPTKPVITASGNILTATSGGVLYRWLLDEYELPLATTQMYTATLGGSYQVALTDAFGCESPLSDPYIYTLPTAIREETLLQNELDIYPNPSTGIFYVSGNMLNEPFEMSVTNLLGKEVAHIENEKVVDLNELGNGYYFLVVRNDSGLHVVKKISITK